MTVSEAALRQNMTSSRRSTILHAYQFNASFSAVFVIGWGGVATILGQMFTTDKTLISQVGRLIVILFGL